MSEAVADAATARPARRRLALRTAIALLLLLFAAVAWHAWRSTRSAAAPGPVVTEPVDRGPIASVVSATGTVNPVKTVLVGTYVSGPIRAIDVDFNSPVTQGQRLAKIDPAPFQMKLRQAEASLASARAKVEKAKADLVLKRRTFARSSELARQELLAPSALDTAASDVAQAAAQLALDGASARQAEAGVEEAKINLGYTDILSPVDGVVVLRNVDVGQTVAASFQTPTLFLIASDLTRMQVDTNVSESDIGGVHPGQPASFTVEAYPEQLFRAKVAQVRQAPQTVQNVVTYDVVLDAPNPRQLLKPGMTATARIVVAARQDVLRVPDQALRYNPGGVTARAKAAGRGAGQVWVLRNGAPVRVPVKTGLDDDNFTEVVAGTLKPGEQVIVAEQAGGGHSTAPRLRF
jgi:HlyD family secretion protein